MKHLSLRAKARWNTSLVLGLVVAAVTVAALRGLDSKDWPWTALPAGLLAGWSVLALINVTWVLLLVWPMDARATRTHATAEDPGHKLARTTATVGSVVSLGAVVIVIIQAGQSQGWVAFALGALSLISVVASWALIQVNYMLHYARVYFEPDPDGEPLGGINFNQEEPPEYTDFAYFTVGLGMTYQVADTSLTRNTMRRIAFMQTTLAYLFGAGILAVAINAVADLG